MIKSVFPKLKIYLLFYSLLSLKAFSTDLNFKYYRVENGLSSNTIYSLLQDSRGFMWAGTENGLNMFDGYNFTAFQNNPYVDHSLVNNIVYSLAEDNNRNLWIGTEKGVSIFDLYKHTFMNLTTQTAEGYSVNGRIEEIVNNNGTIWIASSNQGVFSYKDNILRLYSFREYQDKDNMPVRVTMIYKDNDNEIWASVNNTKHQIYRYDLTKQNFLPAFPTLDGDELKELSSYSMLETMAGTMWFGTWTNGLIKVNKQKGTISGKYLNNQGIDKITHIHHLTARGDSIILIGSNDGFSTFDAVNHTITNHYTEPILSNRFVYPICFDNEGGLWLGTYHGGINYTSPNRNQFSSFINNKYENSLSGNVVSAFCEDNSGNIWIGTEDGGLSKLNRESLQFTTYKHNNNPNSLSHDNIHALCIDGDDLWIGTYSGGLNRMNLKTGKISRYFSNKVDEKTLDENSVYSIFLDSQKKLWIGTTSGVNIYHRDENNFSRFRNIGDFVMDICEWNNNIWVATINNGLHRYDTKTESWSHYLLNKLDSNSIISNDILCFSASDKNDLWIGTSNGLCRYNKADDNFIDEDITFPSNYICKIFEHKGGLWITTLKGLIHYLPSTKEYQIFTHSDGLISELFTVNSGLKAKDGNIFLGSPYGFNTFHPDKITINKKTPNIEITEFQIFNKNEELNNYLVHKKDKKPFLKIGYKQNSIGFKFTALSYFAPEKNKYQYKLEGFDKNWNESNIDRKAIYTNLPPGKYLFQIRASNNDGIWNEKGYELPIIVTPPIWWNFWSISLYVIFILLSIIYLFKCQKTRTNRKNEEKIRELKNEQEKEIFKSKIEFFTNVAHEIRTPLSLISAPLEQVIKNYDTMNRETKENLTTMQSNSNRLLTLVNQLLDFSKIENRGIQLSLSNQNIHQILSLIYNRFKPTAINSSINFEYIFDNSSFETVTDRESIIKIFSNLLSNALKHTSDKIVLKLNSGYSDKYFEISVSDNGAGIAKDKVSEIFKPFYQIEGHQKSGTGIGLYLVKTITEALKGKITIISEPNNGFTASVILPKQSDEFQNREMISSCLVETSSPQLKPENSVDSGYNNQESNSEDERKTLLFVDDNKDMQNFIRTQFKNRYNVLTADDGRKGLSIMEKEEIDIIITDMMMPNIDGIEFCKSVKNNTLWNHIPIIMLTAKTNIDSKIQAFEYGADAYIEKPFNMSYLSARIENLLEKRRVLFQKFTQTPFASIKTIAGNKEDEIFLTKINEIIERNIANSEFQVDDMARELGISTSGLFAKIKQITGETPNKLFQSMRLKKAAELLADGKHRVNEICYIVGFNNPSYFAKCFQKQFGILPKDYSANL